MKLILSLIITIFILLPAESRNSYLAPDGSYVGGKPHLAPDGSYVGTFE